MKHFKGGYMENLKKLLLLTISALLFSACTACGKSETPVSESGSENQERLESTVGEAGVSPDKDGGVSGQGTEAEPGGSAQELVDSDFLAGASALCGSYFKAGDFRYTMEILPGGPGERNTLSVTVNRRSMEPQDIERSNAVMGLGVYRLPYSSGISSYSLANEMNGASGNTAATMDMGVNQDGTVSLSGNGEAAGIYYRCEGNLELPEAFFRPLNGTDLIGLDKEQMRIIRNQFYAVYGRKFQNEELNAYFEAKPWYQGTTEPEQFDDRLLGGMIKRNISFLQAAENEYNANEAEKQKREYDALSPAPYLSLLPESGEILVTLASDREHAEDKGIYYRAEGTISVPVTLTQEQYRRLLDGEELLVSTDELTGEQKTLKKAKEQEYGEFVFGDEAEGDYVMSSYNAETGLYSLWADSADTRFKRVYQGDIYVLKGACEEYYGYFNMKREELKESAGNYRVMDFDEQGPYGPQEYSGNVLVTDSKGYVKALYFWGD